MTPWTPWILQALNGISMGALLFLLASGFTLTFGLGRVVNLAHGAFYLLGGYLGLTVLRATGSFWFALVAGGAGIVMVSWACDRFLIRRTRENVLGQVLLTVGIAYVLADICLAFWGGSPLRVPPPEFARGPIDLPGGIVYPRYRFLLIVFGLAAFLAGLSGVAGGAFLTLYPGADWDILAYALVVVIVGGLGSLEGAMIGSLIVGLIDAYGRWLLPEFSYFMVFGPMALLLMVRPTGLFGREA